MGQQHRAVEDITDNLAARGRKQNEVPVGDMVEAFGHRSYGPFLLIPALIEISPIGGIPGVPTALAIIIALFAVQIIIGRRHLWLPGFVRRRKMGGDRLAKAMEKIEPVARWLDRWFHGRLRRFTSPWFVRAAAVCVIILCCMVPPLEVVPFASTAPMGAIAIFGLAMLVHDGALMIAGFVFSLIAAGAAVYFLLG